MKDLPAIQAPAGELGRQIASPSDRDRMAINVEWRDEGGAVLGRLERAVYDWRVAHQIAPEDSHCLQYIDPVGDAYFNQQQRPRLIRELERALAKLEHSPLRRDAEAVLAFVRQCEGTHTYIVFVGDQGPEPRGTLDAI